MAVWKQAIVALVVIAAAAAAWVKFYPGAGVVLAGWGIDWLPVTAVEGQQPARQAAGGRTGGARGSVITAPVQMATINDRLSAIGTGRSVNAVTIKPFASGRLTEITVNPGDDIGAGSVIAKLDDDAEQIAVDRARVALDDAQAKMERVRTLQSSNTATSVQVKEAELALSNAQLELRNAELELSRRTVLSPIAGIVGLLPVMPGNRVTADTEIATVEDRSRIVIDFWVPERYAALLSTGAPIVAVPIARPNETFEGTVAAVDNRIDAASRTLHVQARIDNPRDTLRAGMSFQITMRFPGDDYPAVNPLAIQWGTDGAFIWLIRDGKAVRTPVRVVQRNTETVLVEAPLSEGQQVVTEGVQNVREGAEIMIASGTAAAGS